MFDNKIVLITGGIGTVGQAETIYFLKNYNVKKLILISRNEDK